MSTTLIARRDMLPADPELRFRPTCDGRASIPVDLLKDELVPTEYKCLALCLDCLCLPRSQHSIYDDNDTIRRICGLSSRAVQSGLLCLERAGWIIRSAVEPSVAKSRRKITLRWKLPDDFSDCFPGATSPRASTAPPADAPLPGQRLLFPDDAGGGADRW